jgi:hypothetical protein
MAFLKFGVPPNIKDLPEEEFLKAEPQINLDPQVAKLLSEAHKALSAIKLSNPENWRQESDELIQELRKYLDSSTISYLEASGYLDPSTSTDDIGYGNETASAFKEYEAALNAYETASKAYETASKEALLKEFETILNKEQDSLFKRFMNFIKSIFKR